MGPASISELKIRSKHSFNGNLPCGLINQAKERHQRWGGRDRKGLEDSKCECDYLRVMSWGWYKEWVGRSGENGCKSSVIPLQKI